MFKKTRIENILFVGIAGLIIVLLIAVICVVYTFSIQQIVQNTTYYQQNLLNEYYNKVILQTSAVEQISLTTTRHKNVLDYLYEKNDRYAAYTKQQEVKSYLAQLTYVSKDIHSIYLYAKQETERSAQGPVRFVDLNQMQSEPWYSKDFENTDFKWIGEHTIHTNNGDVEVISFARKIYSESGQYYGVLLINVKSASISSLFQSEKEASRVLFDSGGRHMLSNGHAPLTEEEMNRYLLKINSGSGYTQVVVETEAGKKSTLLMVWSKQLNEDWTLVEFTPWNELTAGSVKIALVLLLVGCIVIIIALFTSLVFAKQFVKPIRLLLKEMGQSFGSVNKIDLPNDYSNEFGRLFAGYRKLIERIELLYNSLEEQYKRQKEAEIKALQAMINPHFLYNTLDQLNWMAIIEGQEKMSKILELMGKMFRIGLSNGESLITIRDELTLISCYMEIQQIRLGEQFTLEVDIPEILMELYIPKMTLQPFIENAMIHGFHGRDEGQIEILAQIDENEQEIHFYIRDNGNGLRENWQEKSIKNTGGYGIRNVRERIDVYFGNHYGLKILPNEEGKGTTVMIRLPILKQREDKE